MDVRSGVPEPIPFDAQLTFTTVDTFQPPSLAVEGNTPMGEAVRKGLELLKQRKEIYKENSLDYFRPWMFLITDGYPTDEWQSATQHG
jgi:uncharacterized protein YegL